MRQKARRSLAVHLSAIPLLLAGTGAARPPATAHATGDRFAPSIDCVASTARAPRDAGDVDAFIRATDRCMAAMHDSMMDALRSGASNADVLFAAAMIPHHQGAIDMARILLADGHDAELRSLALGIIADQQTEIDLLRAWLARRRPTVEREKRPTATHHALVAPVHDAVRPDPGPVAVSSRDRVYTADQVSNTVSVIDPATDSLLGVIQLGNPRPNLLSALYGGQINVHGLAVSPDGKTLAVVSTGSNAVTLIATATNAIEGTVYVGRNPHEPRFTPDGKELWVTVRGENYISVIDPRAMRETRRVRTAEGPGMVVFTPDGKLAFVDHSFTPELRVVDVASGKTIRRIPVVSPFSPNLAITADGEQVWLTHKDVGKLTVVNARTFDIEGVIDAGPVTNHVTFAGPGGGVRPSGASAGKYAYVTVGGANAVKVYTRDRKLVATIPVGSVPHGVWASGDGSRVYVGLQQADSVAVIDTREQRVIAEIPVGESPQALVYAVDAVPAGASGGGAKLVPLAREHPAVNITLRPAASAARAESAVDAATAGATVTLRSLGPVDGIDVSAHGLDPRAAYALVVGSCGADGATASGDRRPLATFESDARGRVSIEAVGPSRVAEGAGGRDGGVRSRCLAIVPAVGATPTPVILEGQLSQRPSSTTEARE